MYITWDTKYFILKNYPKDVQVKIWKIQVITEQKN